MTCSGWNAIDPSHQWPAHQGLSHWCNRNFPSGPTPVQSHAWPQISTGQNALLIAPTGTGKTLAAFLPILDDLLAQANHGLLTDQICSLYISPLKSLSNDILKSLCRPLQEIAQSSGAKASPVRVGIRTGDTNPYLRQKLRKSPPHILITTPESLSILLSQPCWAAHFRHLKSIIVDEIHSLAPVKRGSDLALSLERLSALTDIDPQRIGLSATCKPADLIGKFLVGPNRACHVVQPDLQSTPGQSQLAVESLIKADESPYRPLVNQRLTKRLQKILELYKTSIVFTNTRPMTERVAFLLKQESTGLVDPESIAAHHGSLDQTLRQNVEANLKSGDLRMVVSSTSLELGVDYQSADYVIQLGLSGSVARCLQRLGRAGHGPGRIRKGLILVTGPAELAGAVVTANAALNGEIESIRVIQKPLDVLCQNLIAMACLDDQNSDKVFEIVCKSYPYKDLDRSEFDSCLSYLSGELASPAGAWEPQPGETPRWTAPRIWKAKGEFGIRNSRVARWFRMNVGTIISEESISVESQGTRIGSLETSYADQLQPGDRFVLDGKALEYRRTEGSTIHAKSVSGEALFPRWTSDRPGLSELLAIQLGQFRDQLANLILNGTSLATDWLTKTYAMRPADANCLVTLWKAQLSVSEVPESKGVLVEVFPEQHGTAYAVHFGLHHSASQAMARAVSARIGKLVGRDLQLTVSDLGFVIHTSAQPISMEDVESLFQTNGLDADVLEGLDRGELIASRFKHTASTGFMVLRNTERGRVRVGGQDWVSRRLYPVVAESCPTHPLVLEARRETMEQFLDLPALKTWLKTAPKIRVRFLKRISPFAAAWIEPFGGDMAEPIQFESADDALMHLHQRLFSVPERVI